jgi:hypothetical protein
LKYVSSANAVLGTYAINNGTLYPPSLKATGEEALTWTVCAYDSSGSTNVYNAVNDSASLIGYAIGDVTSSTGFRYGASWLYFNSAMVTNQLCAHCYHVATPTSPRYVYLSDITETDLTQNDYTSSGQGSDLNHSPTLIFIGNTSASDSSSRGDLFLAEVVWYASANAFDSGIRTSVLADLSLNFIQ